MTRRSSAACLVITALLGCAQGGSAPMTDAGGTDAGARDAGRRDAGPRDAGRDAGSRDAGARDAGATDSGGTDAGPPIDAGACALVPGAVAIDEVMISTRSGSGDRGEWLELVSTVSCPLDLTGVEIVSPDFAGTEHVHTISALTLMPGAPLVLAESGDAGENHLLPHAYVYGSDLVLDNASDWIELRLAGAVLDRVAWPSGGFTHGRARQFPAGGDLRDNVTWARWCDASAIYSDAGGTFYGTPQGANVACP